MEIELAIADRPNATRSVDSTCGGRSSSVSHHREQVGIGPDLVTFGAHRVCPVGEGTTNVVIPGGTVLRRRPLNDRVGVVPGARQESAGAAAVGDMDTGHA